MIRTIKLVIYFFAYQLAASAVITGGYMLIRYLEEQAWKWPTDSDPHTFTLMLLGSLLGTAGIVAHILAGKYYRLNKQTLSYYSFSLMLVCLPLVSGMSFFMNYLNEWLALPDNLSGVLAQMLNNPLGILSTVLVAPFAEELLFRGAIEGHLLRIWKNPWHAILLSALLFALVHGNPAQIPFAFVLGIMFGWIYYRTGSLLPGIWMHFINNASAATLALLYPQNTDSLRDLLGDTAAAAYAIIGVVLAAACLWLVWRKLVPAPAVWQEDAE